jgi:hypothetical protein
MVYRPWRGGEKFKHYSTRDEGHDTQRNVHHAPGKSSRCASPTGSRFEWESQAAWRRAKGEKWIESWQKSKDASSACVRQPEPRGGAVLAPVADAVHFSRKLFQAGTTGAKRYAASRFRVLSARIFSTMAARSGSTKSR